ncbi:Glycosylphosphatidylinositol (GPI) anchor assembly protein [Ascosphaera pollenicola]|nr:Glycosylphosphatidylinositol (GPI) anchor assembly protein [Ascosphaera pollenicola]
MNKKKAARGESIDATGHSSSQKQQRTITDLFSAHPTPKRGASGQPPSNKRQKIEDSVDKPKIASPSPVVRDAPSPAVDMYSFAASGNPMRVASPADSIKKGSRPNTFTPHTGSRKLVVKNLKTKPRVDPEEYMNRSWVQLDDALTAILSDQKPQLSLEQLYKGAENICRLGKAPKLFQNIKFKIDSYMEDVVLAQLQNKAQSQDDIALLRSISHAWTTWSERLFRSLILTNETLKKRALEGICTLIDQDRKSSEAFDGDLSRSSIKLAHRLGIYMSDFEPYFLDRSEEYFNNWVESSMTELKSYVENVQDLLEREMTRCDLYSIDRSTRQKLSETMDDIFIASKRSVLLDATEIENLLRSKDKRRLQILYELLQHISLGVELKNPFFQYMVSEGTRLVFDDEHAGEMVNLLLDLKAECDGLVKDAFAHNSILQDTIRDAFDNFMNKPVQKGGILTENTKTGELIAKYVDNVLRGGWKLIAARQGKNASQISMNQADEDAEISRQLDQVLELFRFVHGKAVFEAFYKNDLARRLLMGRSVNDEAEKSMLSKLRSECGSQFTHNLETMFKDTDLARSEMSAYNSLLQERNTKRKLDLNVHVLSAAAWPSYPDVDVTLPPEVLQAQKDFELFYLSKYHGRKLQWKNSLAYTQLKARFPRGNKEIVVSAFQSLVLLLFNDVPDGQSLPYTNIRDSLKLPDAEVKRTLQSLACAQYRVLTKYPKGRDVNDTDTFTFNKNFHSERFRIKINQIQLKETKAENKATHERVALDRQFETQAAIVRILKARKKISHAELVSEVINATKHRGSVDLPEIKKNIEKLIEKEYIERSGNSYVYVA